MTNKQQRVRCQNFTNNYLSFVYLTTSFEIITHSHSGVDFEKIRLIIVMSIFISSPRL